MYVCTNVCKRTHSQESRTVSSDIIARYIDILIESCLFIFVRITSKRIWTINKLERYVHTFIHKNHSCTFYIYVRAYTMCLNMYVHILHLCTFQQFVLLSTVFYLLMYFYVCMYICKD